jgi:hypothetical protein
MQEAIWSLAFLFWKAFDDDSGSLFVVIGLVRLSISS